MDQCRGKEENTLQIPGPSTSDWFEIIEFGKKENIPYNLSYLTTEKKKNQNVPYLPRLPGFIEKT